MIQKKIIHIDNNKYNGNLLDKRFIKANKVEGHNKSKESLK